MALLIRGLWGSLLVLHSLIVAISAEQFSQSYGINDVTLENYPSKRGIFSFFSSQSATTTLAPKKKAGIMFKDSAVDTGYGVPLFLMATTPAPNYGLPAGSPYAPPSNYFGGQEEQKTYIAPTDKTEDNVNQGTSATECPVCQKPPEKYTCFLVNPFDRSVEKQTGPQAKCCSLWKCTDKETNTQYIFKALDGTETLHKKGFVPPKPKPKRKKSGKSKKKKLRTKSKPTSATEASAVTAAVETTPSSVIEAPAAEVTTPASVAEAPQGGVSAPSTDTKAPAAAEPLTTPPSVTEEVTTPASVNRCDAYECRLPPVPTCKKPVDGDKFAPQLVDPFDDCCALWHCTKSDGTTFYFHGLKGEMEDKSPPPKKMESEVTTVAPILEAKADLDADSGKNSVLSQAAGGSADQSQGSGGKVNTGSVPKGETNLAGGNLDSAPSSGVGSEVNGGEAAASKANGGAGAASSGSGGKAAETNKAPKKSSPKVITTTTTTKKIAPTTKTTATKPKSATKGGVSKTVSKTNKGIEMSVVATGDSDAIATVGVGENGEQMNDAEINEMMAEIERINLETELKLMELNFDTTKKKKKGKRLKGKKKKGLLGGLLGR